MTGLVPTLVPPTTVRVSGHGQQRTRPRPLPVAALVAARRRASVYALVGVDDRGRVPDRGVIRALGWTAGTRLDVRVVDGLVIVAASAHGTLGLTTHGHVRLPAWVRRSCGIESGDRVLLAAEPSDGVLVVHSLASIDAMISDRHAAAMDGGAA